MKRLIDSSLARWLFLGAALIVLAACGQATPPPGDADLTVTMAGEGNGTVTSSPAGINCSGAQGADCRGTFDADTSVTLTATAASGSSFAGWGGACSGTSTSCTVTVSSDTSVTANFDAAPQGEEQTASFAVAGADDAAEELIEPQSGFPAGTTYTSSSDLDFAFDGDAPHQTLQFVGVRFTGVTLPADAVVTSATISFTPDAASAGNEGTAAVTVFGQASANAEAFAEEVNNISSRDRTSATASWTIEGAWATDPVSTADLSTIVQEVLGLEGWASGNAMVFIFTGEDTTNYRSAVSAGAETAPVLNVTYTLPMPEEPPVE
jgi:hypothetical protein